MLQLHYFPSNASITPHILLEEMGLPYELKLVDRANNAQKSPEYLKLNPNGLIPVLVDDDLVLYETAGARPISGCVSVRCRQIAAVS